MNCEATKKLLALYAGGDLPARRARRVAFHLDSCPKCGKLAAEFGASVASSRSNAAPEFDSNFFDDLRSDVLTRIAPKPQTPFATFAERLVPRKMSYVYGLTFASALCLLASYALIKQPPRPQHSERVGLFALDVRKSEEVASKSNAELAGARITQSLQPPVAATPKHREQRGTMTKALRRSRSTDSLKFINNKDYTAQQTIVSHSLSAQDLAETGTPSEVSLNDVVATGNETNDDNAESTRGAASVESALTGAEMLRMEIQTSDPTLRIIWLAPKPQSAPSLKTDTQGS